MAVAVDASSPARVSASAATVTTAAFTPPAGSLLVACIAGDTGTGSYTVHMDGGTGLGAWTGAQQGSVDATGSNGLAALAWKTAAGGSQTVQVTITGTTVAQVSLAVYVLTGVDTAAISATQLGRGASGTNDFTTPTLTTTVDALVIVSAMDFNNRGLPSSSDLTANAADLSVMDVLSGYKTATTTSTTANLNAAGTSGAGWRWVAWQFPPTPPTPPGGIQVIASPARVTAASGTQVTTATFNAPLGALLVACTSAVTDAADTYSGVVTDSAGGTWSEVTPDTAPLLINGQSGYVGMHYRPVLEPAGLTGVTVTAAVTRDGATGSTNTRPTCKVYVITGVDLQGLAGRLVLDFVGTFNSTNIESFTRTPGELIVLAATEANSLGAPTSNNTSAVVDAFDTADISGLSFTLLVDTSDELVNVNAPGASDAAWRLLAYQFGPRMVSTLRDTFEDGSIGNPPWGNSFNGAVETGGGLELPTVAAYSGVETIIGGYDLTDRFIFTELTETPVAGAGTTQALLVLQDAASAAPVGGLRIGFQNNQTRGTTVTSGPTFTDRFAITYSATAHRFLGIRHNSGTGNLTWETSPDGVTWTVRATLAASSFPFPLTNLNVEMVSGYFGAEVPPVGNARFETINVLPEVFPVSIPSAEAWGVPELVDTVQITLISIPTAEAWGLPELVDEGIRPESIPSAESWGTPELLQLTIDLGSIPSAENWGLLELIAGGLDPAQLQWRGLTMGEGTPYVIQTLAGLLDLPELRTSDQVRAQRHGLFAGEDYLAGRVIEAEIWVTGTTQAAYHANLAALQSAMAEIGGPEQPLRVRYPTVAGGGTRQILARLRRHAVPTLYPAAAEVRVRWDASDPRVYDVTEKTLTTASEALPGEDGLLTASNAGTLPTPWRFRIVAGTGGCTDPTVERIDAAGTYLSFDVTLAAGEELAVDVDQRTVLRDGVNAYFLRTVDSTWFELPPGNTPLKFTVAGGAAELIVTLRSAWMS